MTPWRELASYSTNIFAWQTCLVGAAILALGTIILYRERWSTEGILFWLCSLTIGIWLTTFSLMYSAVSEPVALFWARAAYLGVPFIPSAIFHFTVVVLRLLPSYRRMILLSWVMSAFFAFMILSTDLLIVGLYHYPWGYYPKYGILSVPYLLFFFGMMALTLRCYWTQSRRLEKGTQMYHRANRLLMAFAIAYLGSIDYLPKYGINIYPLGYLFVFCFMVLAAKVIWQYQLVDITPAFAAEQIILTMSEPLVVCDLEGRIRIVNPAYSRLFGHEISLLRGMHIRYLSGGEWQEKMMKEGDVKDQECVFWTRSGLRVFVSLSTSMLRSHDGQPQGYVIVARDITERREIERELQVLNETLEERVRQRTEELAHKISELEWLNKVMMGREERILELKEELRSIGRVASKDGGNNGHA